MPEYTSTINARNGSTGANQTSSLREDNHRKFCFSFPRPRTTYPATESSPLLLFWLGTRIGTLFPSILGGIPPPVPALFPFDLVRGPPSTLGLGVPRRKTISDSGLKSSKVS